MSKELEALRQLYMAGAYVSESLRNKVTPSKATELKNVVYQAIKRNEPMRVNSFDSSSYYGGLGYFKCPKCGETITEGYYSYCPVCGQALDWNDDPVEEVRR